MTETEILETEISKLELDRKAVFQKIEPLQKEAGSLYRKIEEKRNKIDSLELEKSKALGLVDWEFLLTTKPESTVRFNAKNKAINELGLMSSSYYPDTNQYAIIIALYHYSASETNAKQLAGLKTILPFIKPRTDGAKRIDILEKSLSANGDSYDLKEEANGTFTVGSHWSRETFTKLEDAFEYIKNNLYYEE